MANIKRIAFIILALSALVGFFGQIVLGIATGTASQCSVASQCDRPVGK